ncbi:hypothetical protein K461DRAFT_274094 [Myriangium duriaei CBS 260.36]|uniref:PXA domain-containing protein n=1 Tax=Myriangium duriaei CBS 260.36 TaxID=1168546 RepID=A0A9P4JD04_9PEZI|nr:hypothetical protein K461DRAFT_274094 [Myriangium duriaei CBS 260.36]
MEEREVHDLVTNTAEDELVESNHADTSDASLTPGKDTPEQTAQNAPQISTAIQQWIDKALNFVSHASNETLGACFVGLGASTYLILGRVGLVLIGVVGGVALHATWEGQLLGHGPGSDGAEKEAKKRRELGLEVVQRVWQWRERQQQIGAQNSDEDGDTKEDVEVKLFRGKPLDFSDFRPETAEALDTFTNAVIRDYVKWWYSPVLPGEDNFPSACRQTLTAFLLSLSSHISRKRPTEMFVNFVINSSSIVIAFFAELSAALNASPNSDAATAIDTYIQMKPDSSLARMLDADAQEKKLGIVGEDILQNYLDPKAYNFPPVHSFLHQILSKLILSMTLDSCSKPEWINGWIVYLLEEGEPEIMQAIDAGVENAEESQTKHQGTGAIVETSEPLKTPDHKRHRSRAEEAMEEALQEAQRLTQMIAEAEAEKAQTEPNSAVTSSDMSEDITAQGIQTPTSSQSESDRAHSTQKPASESRPSVTIPEQQGRPSPDLAQPNRPFTNFDQILPPGNPPSASDEKPVLTLVNAKLSIFDDSTPGEKTTMKSKPTVEYLIQIEPADSRFSGWMIARKFADFEVLHEVLRRISVITGVRFTEAHAALPNWKTLTKPAFRLELERYLTDAVTFQQLAESEGMKRFLEKDQGLAKSPGSGKGLGWPDPMQMGKGMMDVLTKAPREVTSGGKAFFGGMTSVLGGGKRSSTVTSPASNHVKSPSSLSLNISSPQFDRSSSDLTRRPSNGLINSDSQESLSRKGSLSQQSIQEAKSRPSLSSRTSFAGRPSTEVNNARSSTSSLARPDSATQVLDTLNLPPPPSAIDEFEITGGFVPAAAPDESVDKTAKDLAKNLDTSVADLAKSTATTPTKPASPSKPQTPMTEQETIVTVDLMFAVISELYTLSSAWTFRRTLLQAARTFLLRPGNPQLEAIRVLIQESVIDANSSDAGIANLILKTRENSLPTEEELKKWPKPLDDGGKEQLRIKARKLLVERGMPQALTSVMGAAASGEALGKVFDCLQVEMVARSMLFGLMLQALRAAVQ